MTRQQRMKAKPVEKVDPARAQEAETLRKAISFSRTLTLSGVAIALIGCLLSLATDSEMLAWVFAGPGFLLAIIGYVKNYRGARCPRCDTFLGNKPTMAKKLPDHCPICGRKW